MAVGERTAHFLIRYRWHYIILCGVITVLAIIGSTRMEFRTSFSDLLPERSTVIDTFKQYSQFSTPINVEILIKVKDGTIYTPGHARPHLASDPRHRPHPQHRPRYHHLHRLEQGARHACDPRGRRVGARDARLAAQG